MAAKEGVEISENRLDHAEHASGMKGFGEKLSQVAVYLLLTVAVGLGKTTLDLREGQIRQETITSQLAVELAEIKSDVKAAQLTNVSRTELDERFARVLGDIADDHARISALEKNHK
jgi:hypothetical protein